MSAGLTGTGAYRRTARAGLGAAVALAACLGPWGGDGRADPAARDCEARLAKEWIAAAFSGAPVVTGHRVGRVELESPVWVREATGSAARYAFDLRDRRPPEDPRAAFTDVDISGLRSSSRFGAGIRTHRDGPAMQLFLVDVTIAPGWPDWVSYQHTNYDGVVADGAAALFAQNLTITDWNADSAIDNKATISQLVRLEVTGSGYRPLRYWQPGPHYLVDSTIRRNGPGPLIWIQDCESTRLFVHETTFNGQARLTDAMISCEVGDAPDIVYTDEDPRKSGIMHPMFSLCNDRE